jgi:Flp pilus assembly pilin Flp
MIDRANVFLSTALLGAMSLIREQQAAMRERLSREEGQAFVEYAMILVIVSVVIGALVIWTPIADAITNAITDVTNAINNAG